MAAAGLDDAASDERRHDRASRLPNPASTSGCARRRPASYRVLARKYRPSTFDDLIGQDAMVRTISNAFETGRIPQAWILTGVRGVGKTTTARILARALNYELARRLGRRARPSRCRSSACTARRSWRAGTST